MRWLFSITLWAIPPALLAETAAPSPQWFQQYRQGVETMLTEPDKNTVGAVRFAVGNDIWQPGKQFRNGNDWLALVCGNKGCAFAPAALRVRNKPWQGHYDDTPTFGQQLSFTLKKTPEGEAWAVAWFNTKAAPKWLKPGAVASYPQSSDAETLASTIHLPDGESAKLVPMLLTAEQAAQWGYEGRPPSFLLQLRAEGKRQLLPGELGICSHEIDLNYLLWAGDMDRDGKADYLVSYLDADGPIHLYLSSLRKTGQLVGLAGVSDSSPYGGECDGEGWFGGD
ncbi:MAG: hypothetical protein LBB51_01055 [Zoogloeaceae bacterium]|nr:hypothetical protein [Zoogloeaceae bacterium]